MIPRRVALAVAVVFCLQPVTGWAHSHRAGAAVGAEYADRSDLGGVGVTLDFEFCKDERVPRRQAADEGHDTCEAGTHPVGLEFALGRVSGKHDHQDLTQYNLMAGPRAVYGKGLVRPFAHALVGAVHEDTGAGWSLAGTFGWGADIEFRDRPGNAVTNLAVRPQFDMAWLKSDTVKWYPQVSLSLVFYLDWKH